MENATSSPVTTQQYVVIVKPTKSMGLALILTFLFGPLGLLYASVKGGIIMMLLSAVVFILTLGMGLLITWPVCMVWAAISVNSQNRFGTQGQSIKPLKSTSAILLLAVVCASFLPGCDVSSSVGSSAPAVKVANFSFTPENTAPPKSQNVAFVLINPRYALNFAYREYSPFSDFAKSMANDVQQLIVARGFSIFGPYTTPDELVYSDKKNSDIILEISIEPDVNLQNVKATPHFKYGLNGTSTYVHSFDGTVIMQGKIDLTARAVWNQEVLWKKSIPLPTKSFQVNSNKRYIDNLFNRTFPANDAGVVNPFVDALQDYYKTVMQTVYAHLDPNEMKDVKKQADEIKEKYNR